MEARKIIRSKKLWVSIIFVVALITTFFHLFTGFPPNYSRLPSLSSIDPEVAPQELGAGYPIAVNAAVDKCGKHIQFLELLHTREGDVQYSFTKGFCVWGGIYNTVLVNIDAETNTVNNIRVFPFGYDEREPLSENDIKGIKISEEEAFQTARIPVFSLFKTGGAVVWRASSFDGMNFHDIWVSASDGSILRDISIIPTI